MAFMSIWDLNQVKFQGSGDENPEDMVSSL